ncbi:hypothetical protein RHMOL_Rhmol08G0188800 [Rhododendron molle]|uniref:Uncharacterized protein n=1 Tax=Rhododendron molle TaxID=49168 RepID=A0ACC0MR76_RHOML|nr:hypothetical protein RHMOL_Rhmol08G0188800 [Rhododendron molle]
MQFNHILPLDQFRKDVIELHLEQLRGLFVERLAQVRVRPQNGLVLRTGFCGRALSCAIDHRGARGNFCYRIGRSASRVNSEAIYREARDWNIPVWPQRSAFIMKVITNHDGILVVHQQIAFRG